MSVEIECALLITQPVPPWLNGWRQGQAAHARRHRMTALPLVGAGAATSARARSHQSADLSAGPSKDPSADPSADPSSAGPMVSPLALEYIRGDLYRYPLCMMPVDAANLAWVRTALASLTAPLSVPLVCLCHQLRAEAIGDLLQLGADDFVMAHADAEEIRARCTHAIKRSQFRRRAEFAVSLNRPAVLAESAAAYGYARAAQAPGTATAAHRPPGEASRARAAMTSSTTLPLSGAAVFAGGERHPSATAAAFGSASVSGCASDRDGAAMDSFRRAKKAVVDQFECQFLRHALMRHAGNVAGAARASAKHRRAFWALMRKHGINADEFRHGRRVRR